MRTVDSHAAYYERWAKSWEFQALLKARPIAGDEALGGAYIDAVQPKVWTSAARRTSSTACGACASAGTEHIPAPEVPYQIKLGPGGIRDIEFTVQLLQLVHGLTGRPYPPARARSRRWTRSWRKATSAGPRHPRSLTTTGCCGSSSTAHSFDTYVAPT